MDACQRDGNGTARQVSGFAKEVLLPGHIELVECLTWALT